MTAFIEIPMDVSPQSSEIIYLLLDSQQSVSLCDAFLVWLYSHCDPTLKAITIASQLRILQLSSSFARGSHTDLSLRRPVPRLLESRHQNAPHQDDNGSHKKAGEWMWKWTQVALGLDDGAAPGRPAAFSRRPVPADKVAWRRFGQVA